MDEIIRLLMSLGKTKEEAIEFVGKTDTPKGGVDDVASNIIKPITRDLVGDYPLLGSRITDPMSQVGKGDPFANVKTFDDLDAAVNKNTANTLEQSFADQEKAWAKTFKFLREGKFNLSPLQKQNLTYNLGVFQRTKNAIKNKPKVEITNKSNVYDLQKNLLDPNEPIMGGTQSQKPIDKLKEYNVDLKEGIKTLDKAEDISVGDILKNEDLDNLFDKDGVLDKSAVLRSVTESLQKNIDKKKKVKPVDENKREMTPDELEDFEMDIGYDNLEAYSFDGTVGDGARILKEQKKYEAEMYDMYKTGKLDPEAGSISRARMNFLKKRLEEAEGSGDTRLISEDEIFELEGLVKRFRKEDIEFKVNEQPERKLSDEEIKELKDLTDNDDFDFAKGGIIGLRL